LPLRQHGLGHPLRPRRGAQQRPFTLSFGPPARPPEGRPADFTAPGAGAPRSGAYTERARMKCPFCQHPDTQVIDSRASDEGASIRRRRRCFSCEKRFTTYERVELTMPSIVKRGGSRAEYDREKLRSSMMLALRKRPVPRESVDDAIGRIEDKLLSLAQREIKSEKLGELVMRELKRLDKVGYIRFASVYRSFEDVDEFAEVVKEVRPPRRRRG
jgi:transcriptional repressor NrdR